MSAVADKPCWRDAWRAFQDPYLGPGNENFPGPFESFVAGYLAARTAALEEAAVWIENTRINGAYPEHEDEYAMADAFRSAVKEGPL